MKTRNIKIQRQPNSHARACDISPHRISILPTASVTTEPPKSLQSGDIVYRLTVSGDVKTPEKSEPKRPRIFPPRVNKGYDHHPSQLQAGRDHNKLQSFLFFWFILQPDPVSRHLAYRLSDTPLSSSKADP
ncbi:hypothetical protein BOTNAR_0078g00100 [Botryotinia narcissicola]|uniref:Uncharacterized protein n=1 Tax=Botryotinia narcissicola TaxID=278944 RepID=A0A4Z1IXC2_9HELO|nr:hypothetical protein BOTNAR_0078g00100 [Botryotinia narcissicola]